ncbi:hypothetical protein RKK42_01800 [Klebsiella pneumoniae]|nr:hypothetical protein [Klebsiella pneumoniae]
MEIESEARWEAVASTEVCQRWWKIHARGDAQQPGQQPAERGAQRSVLSGVKITGLPPDGRPVV